MFIKGSLFYLFLISILSILFTNTHSWLYLLFILLIIIYSFIKIDYKFAILLIALFVLFLFYKVNRKVEIDELFFSGELKVKEVKEKYILAANNNINYLIYIDNNIYNKEDIIYVSGQIREIESDLDIDVFEFKDYLNNKRVFYQIEAHSIKIIEESNSLNTKIVNYLTNNLTDESYSMSRMLLFNDKYVDKINYDNLKEINAVHLFVVSGFHISFLYKLVYKTFKESIVGAIAGLLICIFYVYLLDFSISSLRAVLSLFISIIFKDKISRLDNLSICGIILLLIEPLNVFNYSFIMSFLMTFSIIIVGNICQNKNIILSKIITSIMCFLVMIPIQLLLNYKINFISLFTNIILSYVVILIFILCIIGMVLSFINGNMFGFIYKIFYDVISYLSSLKTSLLFGSLSIYEIIIFYAILGLIIIFLESKKYKTTGKFVFFLILFMFFLYNRSYFNPYQRVTFLNVYQGDCIILEDSYSNKVMLIDTGGLANYDIASKKIMPYLNYHGIRSIDVVVITHDDYDHNGALKSLQEQIEIKKIIDDNKVEEINVGKFSFTNINTFYDEQSSSNQESIVLYGSVNGLDFLFTGDIDKQIEKLIIENYEGLEVDVLKVAHHGSKTSSCEEFIENISPEYAIISVGKNNFYGHPSEEVIDTLLKYQSVIYQTSINGSIRFKVKNEELYFIDTAK